MALVQSAIRALSVKDMAREQLRKWTQRSGEGAEAAVNRLIQLYEEADYSIDGESQEAERN